MKCWRRFSQTVSLSSCYVMLGLKYGADGKEIRSAYLKLAKQYHPDSPTGDTEKFKQLALAYEVLNDPRNKQHQSSMHKPNAPKRSSAPPRSPEEDYYRKHEAEKKAYEEWQSYQQEQSWSSFRQESDFQSQGYEYYDPYTKTGERYTYSQFKRDKYNKSYKEPAKPVRPTAKPDQEANPLFTSMIALSCLICFGIIRI